MSAYTLDRSGSGRRRSLARAASAAGLLLAGAACHGGSSAAGAPAVPITGDDALRLADQAAFGPTPALAAQISQQGSAWIDGQLRTPATGYPALPPVSPSVAVGCPSSLPAGNTCARDNYSAFPIQRAFFQNAVSGADQLRQRVALAYSQIFVVSSVQIAPAYALREYQEMLLEDAFVNFRQLLQDVTLSPVMGAYLNMANNNKGNAAKGISPNENYAREVLQLFSIGVNALQPDGSLLLANGAPVPTYDQGTIEGFASLFTGWTYPTAPGATPQNNNPQYFVGAMIPVDANHDTGPKTLLGGTVLPGGQGAQADLQAGLDNIFAHPNVGPFIGRQLIQFLVTSNPSPAYVSRITAVFNDDGTGTRGNMAAVVKAILLDPEARGSSKTDPGFGKLREPVVDVASILRALGGATDGVYPISAASSMGEPLFGPYTVFSYYPPSYPLPGSSTLLAPQFGILNTSTAIARLNFLNSLLYSASGIAPQANVPGATGTKVDFSAFEGAAADPGALVAQLDASVLHHALSAAEAASIATAVDAVPADDPLTRARAAAYLVFASPRYQITR
ncbi:MAG TPA: DUF1800 domain-containing protein [Anaeromyxobacteraceae bacterium]|nr:DUF1800 domain-containing protein [Anaeromyxobacteraceae bacterium]